MERAASMLRVVDALRVPHSPFNAATVWDYACAVGTVLQVHSVSVTELANLADKILSHEWEAIPVLCFHTLLHARIEEDILKSGRKFDANDLLDVLRLAVAIAYGDAVGCDGPMKEVVKQTKLNTHIFSIREPEAMQAWVESL